MYLFITDIQEGSRVLLGSWTGLLQTAYHSDSKRLNFRFRLLPFEPSSTSF